MIKSQYKLKPDYEQIKITNMINQFFPSISYGAFSYKNISDNK